MSENAKTTPIPGLFKKQSGNNENPPHLHPKSRTEVRRLWEYEEQKHGGVVKYDGLRKEIFQTNVLSIRFIVPFICYNPTTTRK